MEMKRRERGNERKKEWTYRVEIEVRLREETRKGRLKKDEQNGENVCKMMVGLYIGQFL